MTVFLPFGWISRLATVSLSPHIYILCFLDQRKIDQILARQTDRQYADNLNFTGFKNVLAALKSKEIEKVQELGGKTGKRSPQKNLSDLFRRYGEGLHLRLMTCEIQKYKYTQMVCAAKSGVLQEVLANQFKKTEQGESPK